MGIVIGIIALLFVAAFPNLAALIMLGIAAFVVLPQQWAKWHEKN